MARKKRRRYLIACPEPRRLSQACSCARGAGVPQLSRPANADMGSDAGRRVVASAGRVSHTMTSPAAVRLPSASAAAAMAAVPGTAEPGWRAACRRSAARWGATPIGTGGPGRDEWTHWNETTRPSRPSSKRGEALASPGPMHQRC